MSENSDFYDKASLEGEPSDAEKRAGLDALVVRGAEHWAKNTLNDAAASEDEMVRAVQDFAEAKAALAEKEEGGPLPIGRILEGMVDVEARQIHYEPGAERLRAMEVAGQDVRHHRQVRRDLIAARKNGEEIDKDALEVNGWALAEALMRREQLTQQSEADQP